MQVPTKSGLFSGLVRARWRKQGVFSFRIYMTVVHNRWRFILDNGDRTYNGDIRGLIEDRDESNPFRLASNLLILFSTPSSSRQPPSRAYRLQINEKRVRVNARLYCTNYDV